MKPFLNSVYLTSNTDSGHNPKWHVPTQWDLSYNLISIILHSLLSELYCAFCFMLCEFLVEMRWCVIIQAHLWWGVRWTPSDVVQRRSSELLLLWRSPRKRKNVSKGTNAKYFVKAPVRFLTCSGQCAPGPGFFVVSLGGKLRPVMLNWGGFLL